MMDFVNKTPFPAQAYQAIDQFGQEFHVFVARQTLSFASGELRIADVQQSLCATDTGFDDSLIGSVRQESDYAPYKPRCDVIVNGTARPPRRGVAEYEVRLKMWRHGEGKPLIDKTLLIRGQRYFRRRMLATRLVLWLLKCATLSLVSVRPWKLTRASDCEPLPVRHEYAYGGQCVIEEGDRAAARVPKRYRLSETQRFAHPARLEGRSAPVAHIAFDPNPCGRGYIQDWYLRATRQRVVAAPLIETAGTKLSAKQFCHWLNPKRQQECEASIFRRPTGFGVVPKTHPERRAHIGLVDQAFIASTAPLPENFDFAIWNAAPEDQQTDYPIGGEELELANLCTGDAPGSRTDAGGNRYLRLRLPGDRCTLRGIGPDGAASHLSMHIDTVLIEPDEHSLILVWRRTVPGDEVNAETVELSYLSPHAALGERCSGAAASASFEVGDGHE
jgi:hypothetical protein